MQSGLWGGRYWGDVSEVAPVIVADSLSGVAR